MTLPRSSPPPRLSAKKHKALQGKKVYSTIRKRGGKPKPNAKRKRKNFTRQYGSKARVEWCKQQPCAVCGKIGASENAHVARRSGAGRKGDANTIVPMCGRHQWADEIVIGCHGILHALGPELFEQRYHVNLAALAAETEAKWQAFSTTSRSTTCD